MNLTSEQITIITVSVTAGITLITAIVSAVVALKTNSLSRKNEHKLAILKILLEAAYKEWEFKSTNDIKKNKQIKSFTEYIIFYRKMADVFSNEIVKKEDIIEALQKNKDLIDTYYEQREKELPEHYK